MVTPPSVSYPSAVDWRKVAGKNYVTPVRDQGQCGSCVAFGCVAAVESAVRIKMKSPLLKVDLSEAHLFYCHAGVPGGTCSTGWYVDPALNCFKKPGVVDEKCFPYTDHDQPCHVCKDWAIRVTKLKSWRKITKLADMKSWIAKRGPVVTCFAVYNDFFAYRSGIYHHVSGGLAGGHCVVCVGFNDASRYWICKNSWGTGWGDRGYFKIAYGACGIDATMWAVEL